MTSQKECSAPASFFYPSDQESLIAEIGPERLLKALEQMLLSRHLERRGEAAYQQGKIGGFYHTYIGQEAIQVGALTALGKDHWWVATYRCHCLALLLGATPKEIMAELYGRENGNAKGRGGSMHLFTDRLLGGHGIVGGHVPVAAGAAFTLKYQDNKDEIAVCFLGDGAVAQGAFHESMNLASLWDLPLLCVIENNLWGMGTAVERAIAVERIAESKAPGYGMKGYTVDGMDFFASYAAFKHFYQEIRETGRPLLVEFVTERFRGHSISDPGLYRSREELEAAKQRDPISILSHALMEAGILTEEAYKEMDKEQKEIIIEAMKYADESPWPNPATLEEDVFAP